MGELFGALESAVGAVLSFFYDLFHGFLSGGVSYGLSIIFLTIVINVVVFPLTLKQTRATRAFTALQPEIKRIQAEYKDEPQEMQKRLMEAQKAAGATPGGCLLPLLVQMPIWFALFRVLREPLLHISPDSALGQSIAAGSHSFLGMSLETSPNMAFSELGVVTAIPYLIMIIFMVATQYVQQWHSTYGQPRPERGGGAQQAVTKIMPLFIGFVSWNFPAGLVLYWATSNLFRLGQQVLIFRIDGRPTPPSKDEPKKVITEEGDGPKKTQQGAANKRRRRRRN